MADTDKGGRPSVLTPEAQKKILAALRCGLSRAAAATRAGVGARTFRDWMARENDVEPFASFRVEVDAAEASCEARLSAVVFKAALADPKHAQWLLERRFPASWGRGRAVEATTPQNGAGGSEADKPARALPPWLRRKPPEGTGEASRTGSPKP